MTAEQRLECEQNRSLIIDNQNAATLFHLPLTFLRRERRKRQCSHERRCFLIILRPEIAPVSFCDRPRAVETESIVALAHVSQRFASPIFSRQVETHFRFAQLEHETVFVEIGFGRNRLDIAFVLKSVAEKLQKSLL